MAAIKKGIVYVFSICMYTSAKGLKFVFFLSDIRPKFWFGIWVSLLKTLWILLTADMPQQKEGAPILKSKNNAASSQVLFANSFCQTRG